MAAARQAWIATTPEPSRTNFHKSASIKARRPRTSNVSRSAVLGLRVWRTLRWYNASCHPASSTPWSNRSAMILLSGTLRAPAVMSARYRISMPHAVMRNVADVGFGAPDFFRHPDRASLLAGHPVSEELHSRIHRCSFGTKCYRDYTKSCKNVQCCEMAAHCTLKIKDTLTAVAKHHAPNLAKNPAVDNGGNVPLITSITTYDTFTTEVREDLR